jgi:hypothetical protein
LRSAPGAKRTGAPAGSSSSICVRNRGDTRWLAGSDDRLGCTRMGVRLHAGGTTSDWHRASLERDLDPGEQAELTLEVPVPGEAGRYELVFDMLAEQIAWFAQRGSPTATLTLLVGE